MTGLMMDFPLTLTHMLERSAKLYPRKEIASRLGDGSMHCYTYADFHTRVHRLTHVLQHLGVQRGDRVGTLCWNSYPHLELYFAIPCAGAVLHTLNLRLAPDQLSYIVNHAEDKVIFVDASLLPILEPIRGELMSVRHIVVLDDAAATCYTSGTTGHPKGVVYTHRSPVLHSYGIFMADTFALSKRDTILQLVPMFHANGWGFRSRA